MKKLLLFTILAINLFATILIKSITKVDNYKDLQYAIDKMPPNSKILVLKELEFNKTLKIVNKKNLVIWLAKDFNKGVIDINNSENIIIGGEIFLNDVKININNSKNIQLWLFYTKNLENLKINIDNNSKVLIAGFNLFCKKGTCKDKYEYFNAAILSNKPYINVNSSILDLNYSNLKGNFILNANDSYIKMGSVYMDYIWPMHYKSAIYINRSNFILEKVVLFNDTYDDNNSSGFEISNSKGVVKNSKVTNIWIGFLLMNSNVDFINNSFNDSYVSIVPSKSSYGIIKDNSFKSKNLNKIRGIELYSGSKFIIKDNNFDNINWGVILFNSKADIRNNTFSNMKDYSIEIKENSLANLIKNITTSSENYNRYYIDETSKAFIKNMQKDEIYAENPQKAYLDFPIDINIVPVKIDFEDKFKFEEIKLDKHLNTINLKELKKANIIKGVLLEDIIVGLENGDEDEIANGEYIEIEKRDDGIFIVKPEEYKGCELDEVPSLKSKLNFEITPFSQKIDKKIRFYFEIKTDKTIKEIGFKNDRPLSLIKTDYGYKTKPRRKIFRDKEYILIVKFSDGMQKSYNCLVNIDKLECSEIKKVNF